ncbi:MAG TPA: PQQ-binding-like beta-propeller repeat protein [Clostridia bacterium]|nr:PQQ-binding-like beta-propeller repeat protein [Clostridia bacterium]
MTNSPLVIGSNGFVCAISPQTGEELWRTKLGGFFSATNSEDMAVLVQGSSVFAGCAGHLFGISLETGEIVWHNELPGLGLNDLSLAMEGVSIQYLQKVEKQGS